MLKRLATSLVGIALALTVVQAQSQGPRDLVNHPVTAHVVGIIDGDTVDVVIPPGRRVRVRLQGADSPERDEPFYQQALVFTRVMMFSRDVTVSGKDVDVYGRLVARISVDGKDASEALIAAGLGCTFRRYVSDPALEAARSHAESGHLGFWAGGSRPPACVAREAQFRSTTAPQPATAAVIGNVSSRLYHLTTCPNANCKNCTRTFASRADAEKAGYKPAADCIH
jgi:endonuclease YncB( thermonuclease family)